MAKTAVIQSICDVCGAEVRDGSVYCYNCGSAVAQEKKEVAVEQKSALDPTDTQSNKDLDVKDTHPRSLPGSKPAGGVRSRKHTVQTRDVAWQERDAVSISFIVTTLVMVALAVTILIVGFYLR